MSTENIEGKVLDFMPAEKVPSFSEKFICDTSLANSSNGKSKWIRYESAARIEELVWRGVSVDAILALQGVRYLSDMSVDSPTGGSTRKFYILLM